MVGIIITREYFGFSFLFADIGIALIITAISSLFTIPLSVYIMIHLQSLIREKIYNNLSIYAEDI